MINSNLRNHGRLPKRDDNWAQLLIVNSDIYRMRVDRKAPRVKGLVCQKTIGTTETSWN